MEHLVAGCQKLADSEYIFRHNRILIILAVAWAKEHGLIGQDAQDDNLKNTRSNPGNERKQKDLDMRHGMPAATEHRYEENGKVDEI